MGVSVHASQDWLLPLPSRQVGRVLCAMLVKAQAADTDLDLHVLRDGPMSQENLSHMGCSGPTNILSFPAASGAVSTPAVLLLSVDTLYRECLLYGQDSVTHMLRLLAHGLAHVLGHDHGPDMDALCDELLMAGAEVCGLELPQE